MKVLEKTRSTVKKKELPEKKNRKSFKLSKYWIFIAVYASVCIILNLLSRIKSLSDFYLDYIFGYVSQPYCRLTGLFPFSVGEVLITAALLIVAAAVTVLVLLPFLRNRERYKSFVEKYLKSVLVFLLTVLFIMTLNCNILYSASKLDVKGNADKQYTADDVEALRNYVVEQCNELAEKMPRNERGIIVYDGDVNKEAKAALNGISDEYPRLKGYYPNPKCMTGSYFMYQSGILGVYFPFSMEANYSRYISASYLPSVVTHELSHLKGYIYEDEANFIAYLACVNSESDMFKYSGYLEVLNYIDGDYYACVSSERYNSQPTISDKVYFDNWCYDDETLEEIREVEPVIDTEVMENVSDTITDTYLDYYEAEANYDEVTLLMLQYYDGILY